MRPRMSRNVQIWLRVTGDNCSDSCVSAITISTNCGCDLLHSCRITVGVYDVTGFNIQYIFTYMTSLRAQAQEDNMRNAMVYISAVYDNTILCFREQEDLLSLKAR